MCLPCHDLSVNDVETEITFTEWDRIPGFSMFGGIPCQSCHMPIKQDGTHDHSFIGVDLDLNIPHRSHLIQGLYLHLALHLFLIEWLDTDLMEH